MGLRLAVANGNWSLASTWNGGVLPQPGDVVASNGFTVTIDQNINVDSLTNAVTNPVSAVPTMTGYTTPSGIVTSSGEYNTGSLAWYAFDNNGGTAWRTSLPQVGWVAYEFTSLKTITTYVVSGDASYAPKNFTFEGWNGSSWIVLDTVTNNTSGTITRSIASPGSYIKYRLNVTTNISGGVFTVVGSLILYEGADSTVASVAGGGFVLNSGVTVTCTTTSTITSVGTTLITYSGSGTSTLNANLIGGNNFNLPCVTFSGTGTLNITGYALVTNSSDGCPTILHSSTGTLNFVGSITTNSRSGSSGIIISGAGTLNYTGDVYSGTSSTGSVGIRVNGTAAVVNMTGNLIWQSSGSTFSSPLVSLVSNSFNLTGNVFGGFNNGIQSSSNSYLKVIGTITAGISAAAISSTSSGAINIFTGPFISHPTGIQPLYVARMHYQRTLGSYYEFRDNSTNGALPPAANAPTTRLNSPEVGSDLPAVANVRFGTTYGYGSLTGTLRMPHPNQVTYGVAVDNTFGTAVLTAASVWDYLVDNITTANSIGLRLKNVSTPQTVGSQLASLL
jgi:hypothetical protein